MLELPVLPRQAACPAALVIAGASAGQQGVVCRIMQADQEAEPGLRMNARQLEVARESVGGVYLNLKSDPSTVVGFCHGAAVPLIDSGQPAKATYTACPVWELDRELHLAGARRLTEDPEPESVSMGVEPYASHEADDPWKAGRLGLEELTS